MFIEFVVIDAASGAERIIWASGQTNGVGILLDKDGEVLPEEFFDDYEKDGKTHQHYHKHHNVITSQNQVQVYEELARNAKGRFTTSFIHRADHAKDNRLLPMGWTKKGPSGEFPEAFLKATYPGHETDGDPEYADGSGTDTVSYKITLPDCFDCKKLKVRATLYSQAWAPYFLRDRFTDVPAGKDGEARRRLYYITSHLKVRGTAIEDWKFRLVKASAVVGEPLGKSAQSQHYEYERKHGPAKAKAKEEEKKKKEEEKAPGYRENKGCG